MSEAMMKAYVYHGPEKMSLDEVPKPKILKPTDAIVKVTTSTICGTDKHIRHGGLPEVEPGRIIGHEFCGIVDEVACDDQVPGRGSGSSLVRYPVHAVLLLPPGMYSQCVDGSWIFGYMIDGCQADYVRYPMPIQACTSFLRALRMRMSSS